MDAAQLTIAENPKRKGQMQTFNRPIWRVVEEIFPGRLSRIPSLNFAPSFDSFSFGYLIILRPPFLHFFTLFLCIHQIFQFRRWSYVRVIVIQVIRVLVCKLAVTSLPLIYSCNRPVQPSLLANLSSKMGLAQISCNLVTLVAHWNETIGWNCLLVLKLNVYCYKSLIIAII